MAFIKAVKTQQWLRLAIDGVSGSGKTYTALAIAMGMAEAIKGKVALIDSEHGSASLYADRFNFDTLNLLEFQIENYIDALKEAAENGYQIVIIDSTSHAWDSLVERVEKIAQTRFSGNTFRAWSEGTPLQKKLIEAMLSYPGHIIVTCRSKTEYSVDKDEKGKTTIKKIGTAVVQKSGFEYEFTMAISMDANHFGAVTKDRTGKFQDKFIEKPGKDFGKQLIAWLTSGVPVKQETDATQGVITVSSIVKPEQKPTKKNASSNNDDIVLKEKGSALIKEIGTIVTANENGQGYFSESEKEEARKIIKTINLNEKGMEELVTLKEFLGDELNKRSMKAAA